MNLWRRREGVHLEVSIKAVEALVTHLFQNFIDVHRVSLFSLGFSFRLFLTGTLALLFGYIISHITNLVK